MSGDRKAEGRNLALNIVNKIAAAKKPQPLPQEPPVIDMAPIVEAIATAAVENRVDLSPLTEVVAGLKQDVLDVSPIVKAIKDIELNFQIDLSAVTSQVQAIAERPVIDTRPIINKLDQIAKAMDRNTKALNDLVKVAKAGKVVKYDTFGRITEIGLK